MLDKNKIEAIKFDDYDKMSDTLLWLSSDTCLKFTVSLSTKRKDGTRQSIHQEFIYSSKYNNTSRSRSIKRNIDCYLSIDRKNDFQNSVMIRYQNMIMMKLQLNNAVQWFSKLFKIKDNKMVIIGKYTNIQIQLDLGKVLELEPVVIQYDNGTYIEGIRLYLNSKFSFIDVPIDKFMALYYIIDTFNMYLSASSMLAYMDRPEYGHNTFSMDSGINDDYYPDSKESSKGSFFDSLDKKKE